MSDVVISVENLGKRYRIRHQQQSGMRYKALRDVLADKTKSVARRLWAAFRSPNPHSALGTAQSEDFWALRNVSFEVKQGDTLGIIGRNGAGKSTLLKILSRITEPTEGRVHIRGRVASLLEVGTGFHPELTGRENIFLNGAILGMSRSETKKKFDEIVAFAEIERFLDTPVKRYSSGMYVRLAFAVAAHLEPEILVVDEVLAVGDADFQKKCLGKMQHVSAAEGRTLLFVSHNLRAVQMLCQTGILLKSGRVECRGAASVSLRQYLESTTKTTRAEFPVASSRPSITFVNVKKDELQNGNLVVEVGFKSPFPLHPPVAGLVISSAMGTPVYGTNPRFHRDGYGQPKIAEGVLRMEVKKLPIHGGTYTLSVWIGDWQNDYDEKRDVLTFEFKSGYPESNTPAPEAIGFIDIPARWSVASDFNYFL